MTRAQPVIYANRPYWLPDICRMNWFRKTHRQWVIGFIAPLLILCVFNITSHAASHLFHKFSAYCDVVVSAEKNSTGALPDITWALSVEVYSPLPVIVVPIFAPSTPYPCYLSRAPPFHA